MKKGNEFEEILDAVNFVPGGIAKFKIDNKFELIYANQGFFNIMGLSEDFKNNFFAGLDNNDVEFVDGEKIRNFLINCKNNKKNCCFEYQHQMPDKSLKLIFLQIKSRIDANGKEYFYGLFSDITEVKQSETLIGIGREEYQIFKRLTGRSLFEYHIATHTMKHVSLFAKNGENTEIMLNYHDTMLSKNLVFDDDLKKFQKMCDQFDAGEPMIEEELRLADENGNFVWCKIQAATIYNNKGQAFKVIGKVENIDTQKREMEQFKEKSKRDPLTSFYNKIVIEEAIDEYVMLAGDRVNGALFIIDIDNFKTINDTQGHLFGDVVLLEIAKVIKQTFKVTDLIGRVGGDEFVVFLKDISSIEMIEKKAQEVCSACRTLYTGPNLKQKISCSIGISLFPTHGTTYKNLVRKADEALYVTKGFNKNDYTIYGMEGKINESLNNQSVAQKKETNNERHDELAKKKLSLIRIFEILFDTKDIKRGIDTIVALIGSHYDLDCVYILEKKTNHTSLEVTYEWCQGPITSRKNYQDLNFYGEKKAKLFLCDDVDNDLLESEIKLELQKRQVKSIVQYALYENEKFNGTIVFEVCRANKNWNEEDVEELMIISKFIGSYLGKMQVQNEIEKLAYTDALTGMWNFNKFKIVAENLLESLTEDSPHYAMICFDIKKFRYINDTFGFEVGDEILLHIANYLKKTLRKQMIFTRMSADKFLVLLSYEKVEHVLATVNLSMEEMQYFVSAKTGRYKLIFNAGIYLIHKEDSLALNAIVDKADIARNKAHCGHDSNFVFYNETFRQKLMKEKEIEDLVDYALEYKEFVVYYQPKIDLLTGRIKGAEALVRWISPIKGFMSPADFIPLFEKNGFIAKLDFYVFERVFSDLRKWLDEGKKIVPISINLSRVHLSDGSFIEKLEKLLKQYNIDPKIVEIELTESVFMENISSIIEVMHQLKEIGFLISIDDFGSGYSSLRLLRDLPVDYLKLDKEFLDNGDNSIREQIIIMNVIRMAKTLGIKVVSEGVETATQATFLKSCACDLVQGFYYARPMPLEDFEKKMEI